MSRSLRFDDELLPDFMQRFYGYGTAGGIICLSVWKKAAAIGLRRFANGFKGIPTNKSFKWDAIAPNTTV
ncbi:hypothetical protein [Laspinema olomoucense]|uniref:hypothetical protein n=1 Tax=Laspinema olomoucense TaxID=3231600 RepID=UPI0021BB53F4|nr:MULTISPECIES: hypothetical protein [unclassified Laspinema]MCT7989203.1 hypothetical protein [Laspinema sp. D3a]MCT7992577.1 hypothetical protein [Laspinema sp. D3c]